MGLYFSSSAIIIAVILAIMFFTKKKVDNRETKIYRYMLIGTLFMLFLEIFTGAWYVFQYDINGIYKLFSKMVMISYIFMNTLFSEYLIAICYEGKKKNILFYFFIIFALLVLVMPLNFINHNNSIIPNGIGVLISYGYCVLFMLYQVILCIKFRKKISIIKFTPYYIFLILGMLNFIVTLFFPATFLIGYMFFLSVLIMYHTIENPDMKMLKEIQQSKEFAEQSNNEKAMFLYNMSQEIKLPVKSIEEKCEEIMASYELSDELREEIREVKFAAKKLSGTINGTLDMSKTQANSIEIKVSKYNSKMLFKELVSISRVNMKDKPLDFRINIDDAIPEYLMGDSIRLKQIITTIINNAIKHTEKGFIEFNVSSVIKHDMCRLIMTVEDSGKGIESHKLETLFYNSDDENNEDLDNTKVNDTRQSLSVVKILTNLIGGTVIVNSELGKGSKFTVVLDQKIVEEKTSTMIAIEKLSSNKRILVVDDEEESLNKIVKVLNKYDVNVDTVMWGQECLEKIRKKQKYDLILMDEDMPRLNGIKTFEKLKLEEEFNTPVVIMIDSKHLDYKERYLYNGFSNCVVKPFKKADIDKIIKKYLKLDE